MSVWRESSRDSYDGGSLIGVTYTQIGTSQHISLGKLRIEVSDDPQKSELDRRIKQAAIDALEDLLTNLKA